MLAFIFALPDPRDLTVNAVILTAVVIVLLCLLPLIAQFRFSRNVSVRPRQQVNLALALAFSSVALPGGVIFFIPGPWTLWLQDHPPGYFGIWVPLLLAVTSLAAAVDLIHLPRPSPVIGFFSLVVPGLYIYYYTGWAVNNAFCVFFWWGP